MTGTAMDRQERQFLLTAVWLFMRHGRQDRALGICEALCEDDPRDGASAAAYADILLGVGDARKALDVINSADFESNLSHASAVLETRALLMLGRDSSAKARWARYLESRKGAERKWVQL
jgi:predicted Zn-dependent protease